MFDWLVETFNDNPYLGVAAVFLICGLGFPLPEEIVLISAGYVCFKGLAELPYMVLTSVAAILVGDLVPFFLGRTFGSRLLRIRSLRMLVTKRRLAMLDRWFRKRGDLVIFFARFVTGLRIVAYFTAGTMKMPYLRFMTLDLIGIGLVVPVLVWVGARFGNIIDDAIEKVLQVERGLLIAAITGGLILVGWYWLRRRRRQLVAGPSETFVGPSIDPDADSGADSAEPDSAEPEE